MLDDLYDVFQIIEILAQGSSLQLICVQWTAIFITFFLLCPGPSKVRVILEEPQDIGQCLPLNVTILYTFLSILDVDKRIFSFQQLNLETNG